MRVIRSVGLGKSTSIDLTPTDPSVEPGHTKQLTATARDQFGRTMQPQPDFTWTAGDSSLGSIDNNGLFTAENQEGGTSIGVSADGVSTSTPLVVTSGIVNFDDLAVGATVSNQYAGAIFSTAANGTTRVVSSARFGIGNSLAVNTTQTNPNLPALYVTFAQPVNNLTFDTVTNDDELGAAGQVQVFMSDGTSQTVSLPGSSFLQTIDLTSFHDVTSLTLTSHTDENESPSPGDDLGLSYDNFRFGPAIGAVSVDSNLLEASDDGTLNLIPLRLDVPKNLPDGATVTLSTQAANVDVWNNDLPAEGDSPLIDASTSSKTWTVGTDTIPATLYVGATSESETIGDVIFDLAISGQTTPPGGSTATQTSETQPATKFRVKITAGTAPNGDNGNNGDVTNRTRDWLIGQMVDLNAVVLAPPGAVDNATYDWAVQGNILRDYVVDSTAATAVKVTNDDGGTGESGASTRTGYHDAEIRYFWVSTATVPGPDTQRVTVTVTVDGKRLDPMTTAFNVYSPIASVQINQGTAAMFRVRDQNQTQFIGLRPATGSQFGISWNASVGTPSGHQFPQGEFNFVQLVKPMSNAVKHGSNVNAAFMNTWVLDGFNPTPPAADANGPITAFNAPDEKGWLTDSGGKVAADNPRFPISDNNSSTFDGITSVQLYNAFHNYLMYKPPGASSRWVPLATSDWSFLVTATFGGQSWSSTNGWKSINPFFLQQTEPTWSNVAPYGGNLFP